MFLAVTHPLGFFSDGMSLKQQRLLDIPRIKQRFTHPQEMRKLSVTY